MRRHPALQGLSSEHHAALVMARDLSRLPNCENTATDPHWQAAAAAVLEAFDDHIEAHFVVEETLLFPHLQGTAAADWLAQSQSDHAYLRQGVARVAQGDWDDLPAWGERLQAHVRLEERALFPWIQDHLPGAVLAAIGAASPHPKSAKAGPETPAASQRQP